MSNYAIKVENLSKLYRIGHAQKRHDTLRDALVDGLKRFNVSTFQRSNDVEDTIWALKDISFEVQLGEVLGIIGRNGAGKTTLLKVLSRITEPTSGRAVINGRVGSLLEVGTGFHPELTGRENIYLNGAILGMTRREIDQKFEEIVDFAEIEKFLDTPVKRYSSGMYVRLAFAVAAHLEPEILLVDEVLAVGDSAFQKKCLGKMGQVAREGRTVLFVSHNMGAIQQLCALSLLIQDGILIERGPTSKVIESYFNDASFSESGDFDLTYHPARQPGKIPIIKRVLLKGKTDKPSATFFPNESLTVEIYVETQKPIREPRVAVAIEDQYGRRIMTLASFFFAEHLFDISGSSIIRCTLPEIKLGSGKYLISVSIATKPDGLLDSLDSIGWFEVVWRNNYLNGEPYYSIYGPMIVESIWTQSGIPVHNQG